MESKMEGENPAFDVDRSWPYLRNSFVPQAGTVDALDPYMGSSVRRVRRNPHPLRYDEAVYSAITPVDLAPIPETYGFIAVDRERRCPRRSGQPARAEFPGSGNELHRRCQTAHSAPNGGFRTFPLHHANSDQIQGEFELIPNFSYFDGESCDEDYLDWEQEVDDFFYIVCVPLERQVRVVVHKLTGRASAWWMHLTQARRREGRRDVKTWSKMKCMLREQFLSPYYEKQFLEVGSKDGWKDGFPRSYKSVEHLDPERASSHFLASLVQYNEIQSHDKETLVMGDASAAIAPPHPSSQLAPFKVHSIESSLSATSLKNRVIKTSLDSQASFLRIDESLSPSSLDSVVVAERDIKNDKFTNSSPINSPECVDAEQLMQGALEQDGNFVGTPYVPVYVTLATSIINNYCQLVDPEAICQELEHLKALHIDGVVVDCWWGIVEGWSPHKYQWSGYRDLFNIIRDFKLKLQVVMAFHETGGKEYGDMVISPPKRILEIGQDNQDIFFTDQEGRRNTECLSWGIDKERVLKGRTGIEVYFDFMRSFRMEFGDLFEEGLISAIEIGLGAPGEDPVCLIGDNLYITKFTERSNVECSKWVKEGSIQLTFPPKPGWLDDYIYVDFQKSDLHAKAFSCLSMFWRNFTLEAHEKQCVVAASYMGIHLTRHKFYHSRKFWEDLYINISEEKYFIYAMNVIKKILHVLEKLFLEQLLFSVGELWKRITTDDKLVVVMLWQDRTSALLMGSVGLMKTPDIQKHTQFGKLDTTFTNEFLPHILLGESLRLDDAEWISYLSGFIGWTLEARQTGSDLRGYFVWSFVDLFELMNGKRAVDKELNLQTTSLETPKDATITEATFDLIQTGKLREYAAETVLKLSLNDLGVRACSERFHPPFIGVAHKHGWQISFPPKPGWCAFSRTPDFELESSSFEAEGI